MLKNRLVSILLFLQFFYLYSQENNNLNIPELTQKGFAEISYLSVKMPADDRNLSLAGMNFNLYLNDWAYAGLGMYAAVAGDRGGLFTLQVNAGIRKNLFSNIYLNTGLHLGGGGGANAPDGGGAYVLAHLNLGYQFSKFSIETGYSYINFFDQGNIEGHQLNVALQVPFSYNYASFNHAEKELIIDESLTDSDWYQTSNQLSLLLHFNNLYLLADKEDSGASLKGETIRTAGVELDSYFSKNTFLFIKADGAYHGIQAGYMDIILGLGHQLAFNKGRTKILGKFGIGAAGGGGVDTQGGFVIYPNISLEQKIFSTTFLSFDTGLLMSPNARFAAWSYGVGLKHYINLNGLISSDDKAFTSAKFKGLEVIAGQEIYFDAERYFTEPQNLQQILLQLNFYLNKNIYVSGQTSFANFGDAGAYAEGIVGGGISTSSGFSNRIQLFTQILIGAAGGGAVDTGEGLIVKPSIGASLFLNDKLGIRTSLGQVKSINGELYSTLINIGLNYRISMLKAK